MGPSFFFERSVYSIVIRNRMEMGFCKAGGLCRNFAIITSNSSTRAVPHGRHEMSKDSNTVYSQAAI